jgi:hypothetical protein
MKKTILLFALGLVTISLTSCSRGYGCPYTLDTTIQNQNTNLAQRKEQKNAKSEEASSIVQVEAITSEEFAD